MKKLPILFLLFTSLMWAQNNFSISGTIKDQSSGETLFGATVFILDSSIGTTTNEYGFYSITAPEGNYTLVISYMGFDDIKKEIVLNSDQNLNVEITESSTQLNEVILKTEDSEDFSLRKPQRSVSILQIHLLRHV